MHISRTDTFTFDFCCPHAVLKYDSANHIMAKGNSQKQASGFALEFEAQLWAAADKMRGHMVASEYKHVGVRMQLGAMSGQFFPNYGIPI